MTVPTVPFPIQESFANAILKTQVLPLRSLPKLSSLITSCSIQGHFPELYSPARGRQQERERATLKICTSCSHSLSGGEAWRLLGSHTGQNVELTQPARGLVAAAYPATGVALPSLRLLPTNLINRSGDTAEQQPLTHSGEPV